MASSILVREALFRVSSQLNDISPQFSRWTQRELVSWLNDAQKAIAKYIPSSCARVDAIKLKPGTKQSIESIASTDVIPGDGSTASLVLGSFLQSITRNMGANGATPGKAIRVVDREILDTNRPEWHTDASTPISQYCFDPRFPKVFYVYPGIPSATSWWVEASFLANPVEIPHGATATQYAWDGADNTKLSVDDKYIDDVVAYVMARAYLKDAEFAANAGLAQAYTAIFNGSIGAQAAALTGVNPNLQSLPLNPNVPTPGGRS